MKMYKKLAMLVATGMVLSTGINGLYAKETQMSQEAKNFLMIQAANKDASSSGAIKVNKATTIYNGKVKEINGKICYQLRVVDENGISRVTIGGKTASKDSGTNTDAYYYIEVTKNGTYNVSVTDYLGNTYSEDITVKIEDREDPDLELSYPNSLCGICP